MPITIKTIACPDAAVQVNGDALTNIAAGGVVDVPVQFRNNQGVGSIESGVVRIPQGGVIGKTGQTTSYAANDDGDREEGEGVDFLTLEEANAFGNTNRFTDTVGGQTYSNNIVLDHLHCSYKKRIIAGYFRTPQSAAAWATVMALQPFTLGGFSGWYVPNGKQLAVIVSGQNGMNYAPFNAGVNLMSSSTSPLNTANVRSYVVAQGAMGNTAKTSSQAYIAFRYFTFNELGL